MPISGCGWKPAAPIRFGCIWLIWGIRVAGDEVYGKPLPGLQGQCLHAREIGFRHPRSGAYLHFTSPLPAYFTAFLEQIAKD